MYFVTIHGYFWMFLNEKSVGVVPTTTSRGYNGVILTNKSLTPWFCPTIICWSTSLTYLVYQLQPVLQPIALLLLYWAIYCYIEVTEREHFCTRVNKSNVFIMIGSYFNTHSADIRMSDKVNPFTTGSIEEVSQWALSFIHQFWWPHYFMMN